MRNNKAFRWLLAILAVLALIGVWTFYSNYQRIGLLNEGHRKEVENWITNSRNDLNALDQRIAEAIVTPDGEQQRIALLGAYRIAAAHNHNRFLLRETGPYFPIYEAYSQEFYTSSLLEYIDYLLRKNDSLKELERSNLGKARQYIEASRIAFDAAHQMRENVAWTQKESEEAQRAAAEFKNKTRSLPSIGGDDDGYLRSFARTGEVRKDIFRGENEISDEAGAKIAKKFMGKPWEELQAAVGGGGSDAGLFGEHIDYYGQRENAMASFYKVSVTRKGGHIINAVHELNDHPANSPRFQKDNLGPMTQEQAKAYAEELIKRWGEEPLVLYNTWVHENQHYFTFVPVRNHIPLVNRHVEVVLDTQKGRMLSLRAENYFMLYKKEPPLVPILPPEEALAATHKKREELGVPKLEVRGGRSGIDLLVYGVPVKSIQRVSTIYINASNGAYEGMEYVR